MISYIHTAVYHKAPVHKAIGKKPTYAAEWLSLTDSCGYKITIHPKEAGITQSTGSSVWTIYGQPWRGLGNFAGR